MAVNTAKGKNKGKTFVMITAKMASVGSLRRQVDSALGVLGYGHVNVAQRNEILKKVLSGYAAEPTHPAYQEVIAEAFSEWYNSTKPRPFCKEFLKGVGIIGDV